MPRYKLTVAYDGTDFCGWQKQEPQDPAVEGAGEGGEGPGGGRGGGGAGAPGGGRGAGETGAIRQARQEGLVAGREGRIALRTVQAVLERAVREVVREPVVVTGASRTDGGVHAWGQVAAFTCSGGIALPGDGGGAALPGDGEARSSLSGRGGDAGTEAGPAAASPGRAMPPGRRGGGWPVERGVETLVRAINSRLPEDVLVRRAEVAGPGFDPIADCVSKGYSYTFFSSPDRPLWDRRFVCHTRHALEVGAMAAGARRFVGEHDFAAVAAAGHGRSSTVRTVHACEVVELAGEADGAQRVRIDISGNGFLYNMVRIIAGTLHEIGRGRMAPEAVSDVLASGDRRRAGPTMPPDGLRLEWALYGNDE